MITIKGRLLPYTICLIYTEVNLLSLQSFQKNLNGLLAFRVATERDRSEPSLCKYPFQLAEDHFDRVSLGIVRLVEDWLYVEPCNLPFYDNKVMLARIVHKDCHWPVALGDKVVE